jgi:hypothetical protein
MSARKKTPPPKTTAEARFDLALVGDYAESEADMLLDALADFVVAVAIERLQSNFVAPDSVGNRGAVA